MEMCTVMTNVEVVIATAAIAVPVFSGVVGVVVSALLKSHMAEVMALGYQAFVTKDDHERDVVRLDGRIDKLEERNT